MHDDDNALALEWFDLVDLAALIPEQRRAPEQESLPPEL